MSIRVAINGFGRIGRNIMRALQESPKHQELTVVAINDLADRETNAHLLQYDSVHGKLAAEVAIADNGFTVNGNLVRTLSERNPADLPWGELGVDVVLECTGFLPARKKPPVTCKRVPPRSFYPRRVEVWMRRLYMVSITIF